MALEVDTRREEELKLLLRTELNYKLARERIRHKYEVLKPMVEALRAGKPVMGIPEGHVLTDIKFIDADPDRPSTETTDRSGE